MDLTGLSAESTEPDPSSSTPIEPVVVVAKRPSNPFVNMFAFIKWSAEQWGELINGASGNVNATSEQNVQTGYEAWHSIALGYGLGKTFSSYDTKSFQKRIKWTFGKHKTAQKWVNQMNSRGWTSKQISEAINNGSKIKATNLINKTNTATRYVHPETGKSIVMDDITHEILHIGGQDFKY